MTGAEGELRRSFLQNRVGSSTRSADSKNVGNVFAVPLAKNATPGPSFLDDPSFDIGFEHGHYDDLSGRWGNRPDASQSSSSSLHSASKGTTVESPTADRDEIVLTESKDEKATEDVKQKRRPFWAVPFMLRKHRSNQDTKGMADSGVDVGAKGKPEDTQEPKPRRRLNPYNTRSTEKQEFDVPAFNSNLRASSPFETALKSQEDKAGESAASLRDHQTIAPPGKDDAISFGNTMEQGHDNLENFPAELESQGKNDEVDKKLPTNLPGRGADSDVTAMGGHELLMAVQGDAPSVRSNQGHSTEPPAPLASVKSTDLSQAERWSEGSARSEESITLSFIANRAHNSASSSNATSRSENLTDVSSTPTKMADEEFADEMATTETVEHDVESVSASASYGGDGSVVKPSEIKPTTDGKGEASSTDVESTQRRQDTKSTLGHRQASTVFVSLQDAKDISETGAPGESGVNTAASETSPPQTSEVLNLLDVSGELLVGWGEHRERVDKAFDEGQAVNSQGPVDDMEDEKSPAMSSSTLTSAGEHLSSATPQIKDVESGDAQAEARQAAVGNLRTNEDVHDGTDIEPMAGSVAEKPSERFSIWSKLGGEPKRSNKTDDSEDVGSATDSASARTTTLETVSRPGTEAPERSSLAEWGFGIFSSNRGDSRNLSVTDAQHETGASLSTDEPKSSVAVEISNEDELMQGANLVTMSDNAPASSDSEGSLVGLGNDLEKGIPVDMEELKRVATVSHYQSDVSIVENALFAASQQDLNIPQQAEIESHRARIDGSKGQHAVDDTAKQIPAMQDDAPTGRIQSVLCDSESAERTSENPEDISREGSAVEPAHVVGTEDKPVGKDESRRTSDESRSTASYSRSDYSGSSDYSSYTDSDYSDYSSSWSSSRSYSSRTYSDSSRSYSRDEGESSLHDTKEKDVEKGEVPRASEDLESPPTPTAQIASADEGSTKKEENFRSEKPQKQFSLKALVAMMRSADTKVKDEELVSLNHDIELGVVDADEGEDTRHHSNKHATKNPSYSVLETSDAFDVSDPIGGIDLEDQSEVVHHRPERNKKSRQRCWILLGFLLVIALAVVFGVVFGLRREEGTEEAPAPTPAPTSTFSSREWTQLGESLQGVDARDQAGFAVSIADDGGLVAVGARRTSAGGLGNSGKMWIYRYISDSNTWLESVSMNGAAVGNQFGFAVAFAGNGRRLAVSSIGDDVNGRNSGLVQILEERDSGWVIVGEFRGKAEGDVFGVSLSMSRDGRMVAVGAPYHAADGLFQSGSVYFYEDIGFELFSRWEETRATLSGTAVSDWFGWSVSLSGDGSRVAIGGPNDPQQNRPGYAEVYRYSGLNDIWLPLGERLTLRGDGDRFGYSVSISGAGDRLAVGAFRGDSANGAAGLAAIFGLNGNQWSQLGELLRGDNDGDSFGYAVSLSKDGGFVAVGAPSVNTTVGTGVVNVYQDDGGTWLASRAIRSDLEASLGFAVSLSSEAEMLLAGLPAANQARVYG